MDYLTSNTKITRIAWAIPADPRDTEAEENPIFTPIQRIELGAAGLPHPHHKAADKATDREVISDFGV
jgi:hypothetical protein